MEILTTLQKIQEQQRKISDSFSGKRAQEITTKIEEVDPILQINRTLQYILDKLHSIDQMVRSGSRWNTSGRTHESTVEKRAEKEISERLKAIDSNLPFL